jgi:hypothetical protein
LRSHCGTLLRGVIICIHGLEKPKYRFGDHAFCLGSGVPVGARLISSCAFVYSRVRSQVGSASRPPEFHRSVCCVDFSLVQILEDLFKPILFLTLHFRGFDRIAFLLRASSCSTLISFTVALLRQMQLCIQPDYLGSSPHLPTPWFQGIKLFPRIDLWPGTCHLTNNRSQRTHLAHTPHPRDLAV